MANKGTDSSYAVILDEWYKKEWKLKLLLPGDFRISAIGVDRERFWCEKTTNESLTMRDTVQKRTLKIREAQQYTTDLNYRPSEFKKITFKLINNPVIIRHKHCRGLGTLSCPPLVRCRRCGGRGKRDENCESCHGDGRIHKDSFNFGARDPWDNSGGQEYVRCGTCGGSGKRTVNCGDCDRGDIVCGKCNGQGFVYCAGCDGSGEVVNGDIVTRIFSPSKEISYNLNGLKRNEFKNGLGKKHFASLAGDLKHSTFRKPVASNTVLYRETVHSYRILSYNFSYKGTLFWLNLVSSGNGPKYVVCKLPFSKVKLGVISATLGMVVASAIASALLTA